MLRIISTLAVLFGLMCPGAHAQSGSKSLLADNAPDRHIVVPGDTLWGIAGKFLSDPWRWPEVWKMNKEQVKNPHRIYPGDIIVLDRANGTLKLAKPIRVEPTIYSSTEHLEIPSIPPSVIDPFLSQPLVVEANALDSAPYIVGTQEGRVMLGAGDSAFARGITSGDKRLWNVYRPGKALKDPESGEILGHEAFYLGSATLEATGDLAMLKIKTAKQEIGRGDRLIAAERPPLIAYAPRKPEKNFAARVLGIYGAVTGGQFNIVSLNKGSRDGLEVGHVLALTRTGRTKEGLNAAGVTEVLTYPNERYGLMFVFRTFERVAYALVMHAERPLVVGDSALTP